MDAWQNQWLSNIGLPKGLFTIGGWAEATKYPATEKFRFGSLTVVEIIAYGKRDIYTGRYKFMYRGYI